MRALTKKDIENIRKNPQTTDWDNISSEQTLSENFVREFKEVFKREWEFQDKLK